MIANFFPYAKIRSETFVLFNKFHWKFTAQKQNKTKNENNQKHAVAG